MQEVYSLEVNSSGLLPEAHPDCYWLKKRNRHEKDMMETSHNCLTYCKTKQIIMTQYHIHISCIPLMFPFFSQKALHTCSRYMIEKPRGKSVVLYRVHKCMTSCNCFAIFFNHVMIVENLLNYFNASNLQFYWVGQFIPKVTHLKSMGLLQR